MKMIKTTSIKTTMMETSINTLLNTISAQITYTRGALIALFAGLFILAACGGGGAGTEVAGGGGTGVDCETNIFDPACRVEKQAEQTAAIRACIDAIKTGAPETCDGNIPTAARNCLNEPFTDGCSDVVLPTSVTIASVQDAREADCRGGTEGSASCESTVVNFCGAVTSTKDGVLFTETLCGAEYNARRSTLVTACVNAVEGGATRTGTACASVAVDKEVLDCVIDPLATGCDAESVTEVLKKAEVDIETSQGDRVAFCRGVTGFATNQLCENAIETTCDANPFTLTTGTPPTNFCTGVNDGRVALIGRCSDEDANNNEGCDATIGTGTTTVAQCITDPFDTTNGCNASADFLATRNSRTTLCTTNATLFDSLCDNFGAAGAITIKRKAFIQECLLTPSTDCDVPTSSRTHTVTQCITNPHREQCKDDLDFAEVKSARTTLCTDTALYFDTLCNTYENIETTRQTRCTVGASSFDDICDGKGYDADRTAGQKAFAKECRTGNNPLCISIKLDDGTTSIAACVNNDANGRPYDSVCLTPVFADEREARSLQCADLILTEKNSSLCTNARANNPCVNNPFGTDRQGEDCDATVYREVRDNRDTYCRGAGRTTGDTLCTGIDDFICDGTEAMGDPFVSLCGDTNHARQIAFCRLIGESNDVRCERDLTKVCPNNPFNGSFGPHQLNCAEGDTYLSNRVTACEGVIANLPAGDAGLCNDEKLSGAICGTDSNVGTDPFAEICSDPDATAIIAAFDKDMEQQEFCGATRKTDARVGECEKIYTGLCTDADLVNPAAGAGRFNCLIYDDSDVTQARNDFCTTVETSFTLNCEDGTHGAEGAVNTAREMLAMTCRGNPQATGCTTVVDVATARTVADCTNHLADGDPYQTGCGDIGFKEERIERDLTCAVVATLEMPLCANAKSNNPCVLDPFGKDAGRVDDCDPTDYASARTNRDAYCIGADIMTDDPLCLSRKDYICDGTEALGDPTASLCGVNNIAGRQASCDRRNDLAGECSRTQAVGCPDNPFNPSYGAYELDCTGSDYYSARIPACRGAMETWAAAGATAQYCSVKEVAGVICGTTDLVGTDAFADICEENSAMMAIDNFDQDTERQQFCGDVPKTDTRVMECKTIYTGLCTDDNLVKESVGAGRFNCLDYDDEDVVDLRNDHCTTPETSFTDGCEDGTHGDNAGDVDAARISFVETCRDTPATTGCRDFLKGDSGLTILECSGDEGSGDPYQTGCLEDPIFEAERTDRATYCSFLDRVNDDTCKNARENNRCIRHPYGTVTDGGDECSPVTYAQARINRTTYCNGAAPRDTLCTIISEELCNGDDPADNPFALSCKDDNSIAQGIWCRNNSGDFKCDGAAHLGACSARPFDTITPHNGGEDVDCLTHTTDGVLTYSSQRQSLCAKGTQDLVNDGPDHNCDTSEIAEIVCGTSDGENSNPFAAFCANSANDGLNNDEAARLAVRQGTLDFCEKSENSGVGVCVNAGSAITDLGKMCANDGATSITEDCAYTQYFNTQKAFCADKGSLNIFNAGCKTDGKHGEVTTAREDECRQITATPDVIDRDTECPQIVIDLCVGDEFVRELDNETDKGYLCGTVNNVDYVEKREMTCGDERPTTGNDVMNCGHFLNTLCMDKEFTTAGTGDYYNCAADDEFDGVREAACGVTRTAPSESGTVPSESDCMATRVDVCTEDGMSLIQTASNGYVCSASEITEVITERQRFCAGSAETSGCPIVLAGLCTDAASFSNSVDTGNTVDFYNCRDNMHQLVVNQRRAYCAEDENDVTGECPGVLATLCTTEEASSVGNLATSADGNEYNCLTSKIPAVKNARQAFCSDNVGTAGCDTVLSGLCTGANSLLDMAETGIPGRTFNCVMGDTYKNAKEIHCEANPTAPGCAALLTTLCMGANSVETQVGAGDYDCAGDDNQLSERQTHCRIAGNQGGLCTQTITDLCGDDPFESVTGSDVFGSLCVDSGGPTTYAADRDSACRIAEASDGAAGEKCEITKKTFCDGEHVGDDPYAKVCGENTDNQVRFCRIGDHSTTVGGCGDTIANTCHVDNGNPFDSLCGTARHGDRVTRCRQSILETDPVALPGGENCAATIALECAGGSNGETPITANPFDTICFADGTYNSAREDLCRPSGADNQNLGCAKTIENYCGKVNAVNTANLFNSLCTIGTTYDGDRTTFCTMGETIFDARCDDSHGDVTDAQKAECLKTGSSTYTRGDVVCPMFVTDACEEDAFTKHRADGTSDLCLGDNRAQDNTYEKIRLAACNGETGPLPSGTLCKTPALSGMICGDGVKDGVVGTNPFADVCKSEDGNIHYAMLNAAKEVHCQVTPTATGCPAFLTDLCDGASSVQMQVGAGEYNCAGDTTQPVITAREDFCREDDDLDGLCTTTIVGLCIDDPFELKANGTTYVCGTDVGGIDYVSRREETCKNELQDSKCTPTIERVCGTAAVPVINETNVDNGLCAGSVYNIARGVACSKISDAVERARLCGAEDGGGDWAAFCNTSTGANDPNVCPLTYNDGTRRACIDTNPFDVSCDATYHGNRVTACIDKDKMATVGNNCDATVLLVCAGGANGDDTIDANPFHELCNEDNEGTTYDKARLDFCEGDPANLPTDVAVSACKDDKLSGMICGTGEDSASTHGSNPYAEICNDPTALLTDNFDLTVARKSFCTEFSYNNNCIDNEAVKWKDTALDEAGAPGLNVLSAGDADEITNTAIDENNPVTNYILGQTGGLNLGFDQADVPGTITGFQKGDLKLEVLDATYVDAGNGVAFATFANDADTNTQQKFYAGLLSNTDLGDLLTAPTAISTIWKARAAIIVGGNAVVTDDDFTLEVIFGGDPSTNTITTRAGDPIDEFGTDISFAIAGKFNDAGVIFGTTTYTDSASATSTGSLTGLIGEYGAVGAFISDITNDAGDFAGGFVADNPNTGLIDCTTANGIPFNKTACPNAGDFRTQLCMTRNDGVDLPLGFNETTDCANDQDIVDAICTNTGSYANIFDTLCNTGYETERTEFCKTIADFGNSDCDGGNRKVDICDGNDADDNPYAKICGPGTDNLAGQRTFCRLSGTSTPVGECIDTVASTCHVDTNPFDTFCGESYHTQRATRCRDSMPPNSVALPGGVLCTDTIKLACEGNGGTITENPFDSLCGSSYDGRREVLCRDNSDADGKGCADTIENFCGTDENPHATNDIFNSLCDTGYETARQRHCLNLATIGADIPNCGEEDIADTILGEYCETGQNAIHCPEREMELDALVNTLDWENTEGANGARNSDNSGRLTILDSVGSGDTSDYNYVKAGKDGLKIDDDVKNNSTRSDNTLMLLEAGTTDALGSGVAFTRIDYDDGFSHQGGDIKYYAGILSGTDLGGPVATSEEDLIVEWDLVISLLIDNTLERATSKLFINLGNRTFEKINTNNGNRNPTPAITIGSFPNTTKFFIRGGYTTEGIIYGTTGLGENKTNIVSDGTLTGLIGEKGAVAAFVSDGVGNDNEFVGGFVADNPAITPDCSLEGGNAFDPNTCPLSARLPLCRDRADTSVTTEDCKTAEIRGVVCAVTGNYANLVDSICDGGDYEAAREDAFCVDLATGGQANPFHSVCLDPMVADMYDVFRQTACAGQPVDAPSGGRTGLDARCNDPIIKLCEADPFNPTAGAGATKFNCLAASDSNYVMARQAEINLCVNGTTSEKQRGICSDAEVLKITNACDVDTGDPLASVCTPYAVQYMIQRETRLNTCREDATTRGDAVCTNALSTICTAADTPFSDLCTDYLMERKNAVETCLSGVIANSNPLPEICNAIVVVGKTVSACIADPFDAECFADFMPSNCDNGPSTVRCQNPFYAASVRICETEETSFTAGCLVPANGFVLSEGRSSDSQDARRDLIQRCLDGNNANDAGCNTMIAGGKTVENCIDNPFDADCRGAAIALALTQSPAALAKRTALVTRCADSQMDRMNCDTMVAGAGSLTIAQCTSMPFEADCSGDAFTAAFNRFRGPKCTTPATSFKAGCTEDSYSVTETVDVIDPSTDMPMIDPVTMEPVTTEVTTIKYRDTARAELALGCADAEIKGENGCNDIIVSGILTVDDCNANPFATGCESPAFINARLEACKNDDSPNAACSVATALERTNYVTDLDTNPGSLYVGDAYVDTNSVLKEGVQVGGLNLNAAGYTADSPTDQSASGFALAYIPDVRDSSRRVTSPSRYYAGLLAATDVGPEFYNATGTAEWTGKLSLVNKGVLSDVADFTLDINFDTRTIGASDERTHTTYKTVTRTERGLLDEIITTEETVVDKSFPVKVDYAHTTLGQFYIDGKFTTKGVIYGTTRLVNDGGFRITEPNAANGLTKAEATSVPGEESSRGSLTGVIGQNGAVGAFISSGSGNTFGEYAGGFVAAPVLNCRTNPLDIRCDIDEVIGGSTVGGLQENACSLTLGSNPACKPVILRVCNNSERPDNLFSYIARVKSFTANINCGQHPLTLDARRTACLNGAIYDCRETVATICDKNNFDALCFGQFTYAQGHFETCDDIGGTLFTGNSGADETVTNCEKLITSLCEKDAFNSICYVSGTTSEKYNPVRLAHCADHNLENTNASCGNKANAIQFTPFGGGTKEVLFVNVIGHYCKGKDNDATRAAADDDYGLCGETTTVRDWKGSFTNPRNVVGAGRATLDDSGIIAGGGSRLVLGNNATETTGQVTLRLSKTNAGDGIAIATGAFDNNGSTVLQSYAGLLGTSDLEGLGRPTNTPDGSVLWDAQIVLGWQDGENATGVTILRNDFALTVTFSSDKTAFEAIDIPLMGRPAGAKITLRGDIIKDQGFITSGTASLDVGDASRHVASINGVLGTQGAILATFATADNRSGDNAFAGGFVAEDGDDDCASNGVGNPFLLVNGCTDPEKQAEATRCYNNGGAVPSNGDCSELSTCLNGVFSGLSFAFKGNTENGVDCDSTIFDGARAVYCSQSNRVLVGTDEPKCKTLADGGTVAKVFPSSSNHSPCIGRPFGAACEVELGAQAFATARLVRATDCMMGGNIAVPVSARCEEFVARVGTECANNPFDSSCVGIFTVQGIEGFEETAQTSRLAHCNLLDANADSVLCTGALTHCAGTSPSPHQNCGTLVTDYCLGATGRMVDSDSTDACTAVLVETCDVDPFDSRPRCDADYEQARRVYCNSDGVLTGTGYNVSVSLASCKTVGTDTGLDLEICGNGTSGGVGTNPFADVCQDALYNDYHTMLDNAKEAYCGSRDSLFLDSSEECAPIVTAACGVGGFNPSQATIGAAFNPLCRQETYNDARLAACDANPNAGDVQGSYYAGGCTTFRRTECPDGVDGLIGCAQSKNSTPIGVWNNDGNALGKDGVTALEIVPEGGIRHTSTDRATGVFAQAGPTGLDLSGLEDVITRDEHGAINTRRSSIESITRGKIIKFADGDEARGGVDFAIVKDINAHTRFFAGLLRDTNVGGPLVNQSANGAWTGAIRLAIGSNQAFNKITGFTLKVTFTGGGGTITTHTSTDDEAVDGDIDVSSVGGEGVRMRISGKFNAEGVIYGTTDLYNTKRTVEPFPTYANSRVEGTLTGLIGKAGAVGAFYGIDRNSDPSNVSQYIGGFVATPTTSPTDGVDCSFNGAEILSEGGRFDTKLLTTLFHADCAYATKPRARLCSSRNRGFDDRILNICKEEEIKKLVCIGTGLYANPFSSLICRDYANLEASRRTFANQCNAGTATGNCSDLSLKFCLTDPHMAGCNADGAYTDIRTNLESFCGTAGSGDAPECKTAVETCIGNNHVNCGDIVQSYCFVEAGRDANLCGERINTACTTVNPWGARCNDGGDDVYTTNRREFCSSRSIAQLTDLGVDLAGDCREHAQGDNGICGHYIAAKDMGAGWRQPGGPNFHDQKEVTLLGTNPNAEICTSPIANPDYTARIGTSPGTYSEYDQERFGHSMHVSRVLVAYNLARCAHGSSDRARDVTCNPIVIEHTGAGYEAWKAATDEIAVGDLVNNPDGIANFIAGREGYVYLGVANKDVANAATFRIIASQNGFAYASTGERLFTGLLSGTAILGDPLAPLMVEQTLVTNAQWFATLSFLTNQSGSIVEITKEGFVLNVDFATNVNTIKGIESVGIGTDIVFEVAGTFSGNLLSGEVHFGEADMDNANMFKAGGRKTTGILTGIIGAEGVVGVFKSNTGGTFGDFVGGFIATPVTEATTRTWANSFTVVDKNLPAAVGNRPERAHLHSSGLVVDIRNIAGNTGAFIKLDELNEIVTSRTNPDVSPPTVQSLSFANNPALITPDNGDSGITFTNIVASYGSARLAGLFPTTNMGLPLTEEPATAIWRGKMSAIVRGDFQGERDVRFTITFDAATVNGVGTITALYDPITEQNHRVTIFNLLGSEYYSLGINAKFDELGAVYGTTDLQQHKLKSNLLVESSPPTTGGRVSGLIGAKGLIGAFVSSHSRDVNRHEYVGGFYALNPDAPRKVVENIVLVSGLTSRNLWADSFNAGAVNDHDTDDRHDIPDDDVDNRNVVDAFGAGAPAGYARFARSGADSYIGTAAAAFRSLNFSFDKDSGVGFGRVEIEGSDPLEHGYYSGLLRGANVGISLSKNQLITTAATWTGKIALFGVGSPSEGTIPDSTEQDLSLQVTFDGTKGTIKTIADEPRMWPTFGGSFREVGVNPYTLKIDGTFNAAGVISGTTYLYGVDLKNSGVLDIDIGDKISQNAKTVKGELTGLIGTRGAIGSFISTDVFEGDESARDRFAGTYAGGFVVQHPDYEIIEEIKPPVLGDDVGGYVEWIRSFGAGKPNNAHGPVLALDGPNGKWGTTSGTFFTRATKDKINDVSQVTNIQGSLKLTDATGATDVGVAYLTANGSSQSRDHFAALLDNRAYTLGGALTSSPSVIWTGEIGAIRGLVKYTPTTFRLKITFEGTSGTVRSSGADGVTDTDDGDYQVLNNDVAFRFAGTFNAAGVMTGIVGVRAFEDDSEGVFNGIIGERGALGVFKSDAGGAKGYAGGFTAANPNLGKVGVTDDYKLWRVSFNSRGVNRRVSHPTNPGAKLASTLQPQGVNVNQFATGTTHFVEGTATGLNITGSSIVTDKTKTTFNPTLLTLGGVEGGIAFWQGNVNIAGAATPNIQGYGGMLISTDVGEDPLSAGTTTYTGKIQAYVGGMRSEPTDFTLKINYGDNNVDAVVDLLNKRFTFDGRFNFLGVISGDVLTGAAGEESLQGSFNGILGTDAAVGVFKNTVGNTDGTFIGGFVVSDKFVNYPEWLEGFADGGVNDGQDLLDSVGDTVATAGTHFVRATATRIRGVTPENLNSLRLTGLGLDGGVVFAQEASGAGYTGLLSTVNVGLPLKNADFNMVWTGKIRGYVGDTLSAATDFNLTVRYTGGVNDIDGDVNLGGKQFRFDGNFDAKGVMYGNVLTGANGGDGVQGSFNGLIGQGGAVGAFKNNDSNSQGSFVGGFVVKPDSVDFADWVTGVGALPSPHVLLGANEAKTKTGGSHAGFFIRGSDVGINGINTTVLTLTSDANSGVAFGTRVDNNPHTTDTYYTGLLSGTDVGRHIDNRDLNGVWVGKIRSYVRDGDLAGEAVFYLDVEFGADNLIANSVGKVQSTTALTGGAKGPVPYLNKGTIDINGHFNEDGLMWGSATHVPVSNNDPVTSNGAFNGIIGTLGAVGVFKDNNGTGADAFLGGFFAEPQ